MGSAAPHRHTTQDMASDATVDWEFGERPSLPQLAFVAFTSALPPQSTHTLDSNLIAYSSADRQATDARREAGDQQFHQAFETARALRCYTLTPRSADARPSAATRAIKRTDSQIAMDVPAPSAIEPSSLTVQLTAAYTAPMMQSLTFRVKQ